MHLLKKIPLKTTLVFLIVLIVLNLVYYKHLEDILIGDQKEKMQILFNSVRSNIEQAGTGEKFVEDLIGQNLRTAAIAAKFKLNPDIDQVRNQELVELSKLLGIDHITLFKKTKDDIVGEKSSDPKDLGVSSKGWDTYYPAFNQLFNLQEVNVGIGQTLPHYWSGPIDTSTSNPQSIDKWGNYYDGTTNYLINPFVHNTSFRTYQSITGVDDAIRRITKVNEQMGLEISVLNSDKLLNRTPPTSNPAPSNWFSERLVLFGQYQSRDADEIKYAQLALDTDQSVFYITLSNGKKIFKSFTPIHTDYLKYNAAGSAPLISIASDYAPIEQVLNRQLNQTLIFMLICTCLSMLLMIGILIIYNRNKERAVQDVQETYAGNIETLFQSIREQRHDFVNHIQTIHSFLALKHYDELEAYTNTLVGEIQIINDLVDINNPPIIALIQAKLTQAERQQIHFEHTFNQMDKLKLSPIKVTDMVKMLSNLIDNAFDASMELEPEDRYVMIEGDVIDDKLQFIVCNWGHPIPAELQRKLFEPGVSSKKDGNHSGLGLHIVRQLVDRYKGTIEVKSEDGVTEFFISIPLKLK